MMEEEYFIWIIDCSVTHVQLHTGDSVMFGNGYCKIFVQQDDCMDNTGWSVPVCGTLHTSVRWLFSALPRFYTSPSDRQQSSLGL